jgi:hypothetical protein
MGEQTETNSVLTPLGCVHTNRFEFSRVPVKSLDAACFIFVRLQCSGVTEEIDVEWPILLVKDHEAIYDASRREHRNRVLL